MDLQKPTPHEETAREIAIAHVDPDNWRDRMNMEDGCDHNSYHTIVDAIDKLAESIAHALQAAAEAQRERDLLVVSRYDEPLNDPLAKQARAIAAAIRATPLGGE